MVGFKEAELSGGQVLSRDHVGVEAELLVVSVFIASVSLVAYCFYS